jgi:hypothetical protein
VLRVLLEPKDTQVPKELLDHKGQQEMQGLKVLLDHRGQQEMRGLRVRQVLKEPLDQ